MSKLIVSIGEEYVLIKSMVVIIVTLALIG